AGISGETSAGGLRRIDWALQQPVAVLVIELGANDALRGLSVDTMKQNLAAIIGRTRALYPDAKVVIAGMEAPPNLGEYYTTRFRAAFREVARENDAVLIPFVLAGVAGQSALNQPDGIHPTAEGQRVMAGTVWKYLAPVLKR
ncbi:MAG TPA: arylesterase, partial [Longimicrobiales bacterium]|nr:arylesterase [Longimicrobiales bacterium]